MQILPELQLQNLDQTLCSMSEQKFGNKLLPTRSSSAIVTTSKSFELASSNARVTSIKFTKQELVSEWALPMIGLGSDKNGAINRSYVHKYECLHLLTRIQSYTNVNTSTDLHLIQLEMFWSTCWNINTNTSIHLPNPKGGVSAGQFES